MGERCWGRHERDVEWSFREVGGNPLGKCIRTWAWFLKFVERSQPGDVRRVVAREDGRENCI